MTRALPTVVIAGLAGDSGKTLVSLGLVRALARRGHRVAPFKKGPDFIDAAWLGAAAGRPGRNLDTFLMPSDAVRASHARAAAECDVAVVEGNRGLFDGKDARGTHSTAELAKLLGAPVILVVDVTKSTRTVAALVAGCRALDPDVPLSGVILNRVGTRRQDGVIREAIAETTGLPVLGALPRLGSAHLPSRHLGLVTAVEHPAAREAIEEAARVIERDLDVAGILDRARAARPVEEVPPPSGAGSAGGRTVRIGVLQDAAFSFYYPENLESLEAAGAGLVPISPLGDTDLPAIDGLYAGGGFPEAYAAAIAANRPLLKALGKAIEGGLPVWAECGGLMILAEALVKDGIDHEMVGALPIVCEHTDRPQGHGYVEARVDRDNPFFEPECSVRGHEFHHSRIMEMRSGVTTVMKVERGTGIGGGRDGIRAGNLVAGYTHLHALGVPGWAEALVGLARGEPCPVAADRAQVPAGAGTRYTEPAIRASGVEGARARSGGSLRARVEAAVRDDDAAAMEEIVEGHSRAVRHLVSMSYQADRAMRESAAHGIALAGKHHPKLVQNIVRRLVWAMNDESGTNALTAPVVLEAISREQPELLIPMVPDLLRLAGDEGLHQGLAATLRNIQQSCPGEIARSLGAELSKQMQEGACCEAKGT